MPLRKHRDCRSLAERFWPKVAVTEDPWDCWLWLGSYNAMGYGVLTHAKTEAASYLAHRIAWELAVRPIPAAEVIRHLCHEPLCVNPCHLMPGTQSANLLDRRRNPSPKPIPAPRPKRLPVPTVERFCLTCGVAFVVPITRISSGGGLFCSRPHVRRSPEKRFWLQVEKTEDCWLWTGAKNKGYGVFGRGGKQSGLFQAHRFSWELHRGTIPEGMVVCHNCPGGDNPDCVNPDHLFLGTPADNGQDMTAKDGCPRSKLTADKVREMRRRYAVGETPKALAVEFGVATFTAWQAIHGHTWKAVK